MTEIQVDKIRFTFVLSSEIVTVLLRAVDEQKESNVTASQEMKSPDQKKS